MPLLKTAWRSFGREYADWTEHLINQDTDKVFDSEFLKRLCEQHDKVQARSYKLMIFNTSLMIALVLGVWHQDEHFQFLGVSTEGLYKVKEIILFIAATVGLMISLNSAHIAQFSVIERTYNRTKYGDKNGALLNRALPTHFDFPVWWVPYIEGSLLFPKAIVRALKFSLPIIFLFLVFVYVAVAIGVHVYVLIETVTTPTLPGPALWLVIGYVVLADIFSVFLFVTNYVPLPYHDYTMNVVLAELEKSDPAAYRKAMADIGIQMAIQKECREYARAIWIGFAILFIVGHWIG